MQVDPIYFVSVSDLHDWFAEHHERLAEAWIGFYRKTSGKGSITYAEAVDEALCFGWIDGVRRRVDEASFVNRFTPRKSRSVWSAVNIKRAGELIAEGRMQPAGLAALEHRDPALTGRYSFENHAQSFEGAYLQQLQANEQASRFFERQPPGYRRIATFWVLSAKKEETRQRRLATLIECSANGQRIPAVTYTPKS